MKRILIIADSPETEGFLLRALGAEYMLTFCHTPQEGAALLGQEWDGVVLSLSPEGLLFLKDNAALLPPAVLALTAVLSDPVIRTAGQLGVGCLIRIPCTGKEVASRLAALPGKKDPSLSGG